MACRIRYSNIIMSLLGKEILIPAVEYREDALNIVQHIKTPNQIRREYEKIEKELRKYQCLRVDLDGYYKSKEWKNRKKEIESALLER